MGDVNKYNVYLTLRAPNNNTDIVPNEANPIEAADMRSLMTTLTASLATLTASLATLPPSLGIEIVGVRIERSDLEGRS